MIDPENLGMALSDRKVSLLFDNRETKMQFLAMAEPNQHIT